MRNKIIFSLFALMAFGLLSCTKDQTNPTNNEMYAESFKLYRSLKTFEQKLDNADLLKSGELVEVDSLVWYVEALINYQYAVPDQAFEKFIRNQSYYSLEMSGSLMVPLNEALLLYEFIELLYEDELEQIPSDEKQLRLTDVALDSITGNTAHLSITNIYGSGGAVGYYRPFEEGDDWIWGTLTQIYGDPPAGKCNGTMVGVSDGSDELMKKLNNPLIQYAGPYTWIPASLETIDLRGFDYETEPPVAWPLHRLYVGWDYPEDNCLTHELLNFYLFESHKIIYDFNEGVRPEGKSMKHVQIDDDLKLGEFPDKHHWYRVTYGIRIIKPNEQ